jgi:2-polyprenyl-3-methyl-5-hydroxy-6-metoxy-1,4-benzoquinol methylase
MSPAEEPARSLERPCPACGSGRGAPLFAQRFERIEGISIHGGYDVVACPACGACFAEGIPDQATFERYYREASKYEGSGPDADLPAATLRRFREELDDLVPRLGSRQSRILEVGCATGAFLGMLKERGFSSVTGLDPSPLCIDVARRKHGIEVLSGDLSSAGFAPVADGRYDLVVLIAVLEHVRDLAATLRRLRSALAPGGLLFVEVPDASRFERGSDAPFQEFSVEHINFFSGRSLAAVVERSGFRAEALLERDRSHTEGCTAPVVAGLFRRTEEPPPEVVPDETTRSALEEYVRQSAAREESIRRFVDELAQRGEPLVVWGCGTLTLRLLATSALDRANIVAFVDSNPRYRGKTIRGIAIRAPEEIAGRSEPILVSSVGQQLSIAASIRERFGAARSVLTYPVA